MQRQEMLTATVAMLLTLASAAGQNLQTTLPARFSAQQLKIDRASRPPRRDFSKQKNRPRSVPSWVSVDSTTLERHSALRNVPVDPPASTRTDRWKFDTKFSRVKARQDVNGDGESFRLAAGSKRHAISKKHTISVKYAIPSDAGTIKVMKGAGARGGRRLAATQTTAAASYFINPNGTPFFPGGTSWYNILRLDSFSEAQITAMLNVHYQKGVRVIRTFGHSDGYGTTMPVLYPIQPTPGVFSEAALRRYDFVMDALAKAGIRIIITLTNHWPEFGGMGWYVDKIIGTGKPFELFYTDGRVVSAYQAWVRKLTTRVNTVNGRIYSQDPTVFSWELCNECHTSDNYEKNNGILQGSLLYNWEVKQSAYLKRSIGVRQMVSNGGEGWRASGPYDRNAPVTFPFLNWMNSGLKGEDFVRNLGIADLDFATIHVYPDSWGIPSSAHTWVNENWIGDRAALASAAGMPLIFEEFGMRRGYLPTREMLFKSEIMSALGYGVAGLMVWEIWPLFGDDYLYDFNYTQDGSAGVLGMLKYQLARTPSTRSGSTCKCTDVRPDSTYTCAQQKSFGKCCQSYMVNGTPTNPDGFCQSTCGRCRCNGGNPSLCTPAAAALPPPPPPPPKLATTTCKCSNVPPDKAYTCAQQKSWGKCCASFMFSGNLPDGYCQSTCGRCECTGGNPNLCGLAPAPTCKCSDVPPDKAYTCAQQKSWGKCCASFMLSGNAPDGYCQSTCGRCGCTGGNPNLCG